jgi:hypothetical protein
VRRRGDERRANDSEFAYGRGELGDNHRQNREEESELGLGFGALSSVRGEGKDRTRIGSKEREQEGGEGGGVGAEDDDDDVAAASSGGEMSGMSSTLLDIGVYTL